jgi:D-hydroxyproline dehydrogenase subunit beta
LGLLLDRRVDLAVVGAGVVGLAHALHAVDRGLSVAVVERDARAAGASIRNFGHGYVEAQSGEALHLGSRSRELWLHLATEAGFWAEETGTLLVARLPEELAVIEEFVAERGADAARLLSPAETLELAPVSGDGLLGGLWTAGDVRVEPRRAVSRIATWLEGRGVSFHWQTAATAAEAGRLVTSRGDVEAEAIVVAAGHDLDLLLPDLARRAEIQRCTLQMLRVATPDGRTIHPGLATGLALLRYSGFRSCPSLGALRDRYLAERPELLELGVNLLVTQQPDGELLLGDTHRYGETTSPFRNEAADELLLSEGARLLGVDRLEVRERWLGVYAWSPDSEFLVAAPSERVRAVAVTSGIGMTTALGLAERVLDDLFEHASATV